MKNKKLEEREQEYKLAQEQKKALIRQEPNKFKRFWKWVWYLFAFPFIWVWQNLKDWRTFVIFLAWLVIVSSEIWIPYLIALIVGVDSTLGISLISVASTCWLFWLAPGTPFLIICISLTIGTKAIVNKIKSRKKKDND